MPRVILTHHGERIVLPYGETMVGRSVSCRVRFNDPAVSRRHLRVLSVVEGAFVENLSSTNGSKLNGEIIRSVRRLSDGDELQIGYRYLGVELAHDGDEELDAEPITIGGAREAAPGLLVEDDPHPDDVTRPGEDAGPVRPPPQRAPSVTELLADAQHLEERNCPQCRGVMSSFEESCRACGWSVPSGLPGSRTQEIKLDVVARRSSPRYVIKVPVIYSSEFLTLDAVVHDVSSGGMFIATELLDPVGTECRVTVLPDGYGALNFAGVVCHATTGSSEGGRPGIGIKFTAMSADAEAWLRRTLERAGQLSAG